MKLKLWYDKTVQDNAGHYFDAVKKCRKKLEGLRVAMETTKSRLANIESEELRYKEKEEKKKNRKWFDDYHNFVSSDGFLCVGGRSAGGNEKLVKTHMEKDDLVLHTDMAGSPFFVIKDGQDAPETTIKECAQMVAVFSRAWKEGLGTADVFYVKPEQVSKTTNSGESMGTGSFMVRGDTKYVHPRVECAAVMDDEGKIVPRLTAEKKYKKYVILVPGRNKKTAIAKKLVKLLKGHVDDYVRVMPSGGSEIKRKK